MQVVQFESFVELPFVSLRYSTLMRVGGSGIMLVDNPVQMPPPPPTPSLNDLEEFLNTELFGSVSATALMSPEPSGSSSSRASSPSSSAQSDILSTPPQQQLENSFPDPYSYLGGVGAGDFGFFGGGGGTGVSSTSSSFFNFLDEEMKVDPTTSSFDASGTPFDFMAALGLGGDSSVVPNISTMAIDPQLVDSPKEITSGAGVGGHGKAGRKGTVQSGGITKKVVNLSSSATPTTTSSLALPLPTSAAASLPLTNTYFPSSFSSSLLSAGTTNKENSPMSYSKSASEHQKDGDDDDDLPADWRPPPEVFAKMTSKEKRQLRNKISARNFRFDISEYISTLEGDIAERDNLLQAIRTELGSTQSENLALRQEVATLKKALLEGRGSATSAAASGLSAGRATSPTFSIRGADINLNMAAAISIEDLNLPPPAPLPERSAAEELALRAAAAAANVNAIASTSASPSASTGNSLLVPNKQKDLPNSPRLSSLGFWGGVSQAGFGGMGIGGGFTPVHTVLMPDLHLGGNAANGDGMPNPSIGQWVRDVLAANAAATNQLAHAPDGQDVRDGSSTTRPLQENMNPTLDNNGNSAAVAATAAQWNWNSAASGSGSVGPNSPPAAGFDGFVDTNPFTMKTLDAYRMQLWTRMANSSHQSTHPNAFPNQQQYQYQQQQQSVASPSSPSSPSTSSQSSPSSYAAQRKALERELASSSPFTLPGPHHTSSHNNNHHHNNNNNSNPHHLNGLASSLKPAYFVNSNKPNLPSSSPSNSRTPTMGSTLSALLAGKHSPPTAFGSFSSPGSPNLGLGLGKKGSFTSSSSAPSPSSASPSKPTATSVVPPTPAQIQQAQNAMYAAALASTASTTMVGRLGSAFWDAFSGSATPSSSSSAGPSGHSSIAATSSTLPASSTAIGAGIFGGRSMRPWDADKVRKVLEGKAVVRVVDVDDLPSSSSSLSSSTHHVASSPSLSSPTVPVTTTATAGAVPAVAGPGPKPKEDCGIAASLDECMKSLSLGKK
ncbi:hypothetical protein D9757_013819 [Collybiopsis confluens]|uniref:BZIP domain-containing protein n=1 Tax=Collybiopsis confluens TaxID=2823264 RepID=A0A8H5CU82_9AGAR|nr:hypothetical protein D9757_013819 [Collybiopsis confluens]